VRVQALRPELAVEAFDEGVVGRLAGPAEVEHDVFLVGPKVEVTGDELAALVDPDGLWVAHLPANAFERLNDILATVAEPGGHCRGEARPGVDDRQDPDLAACRELVMHEVHRPGLVAPCRRTTIVTQLRLHPPLRHLVAELKTHLLVKTIDPLRIHIPALPLQQHMDTPIAVTHARLADLLDPLPEGGLIAAPGCVGVERPIDLQSRAGPSYRDLPGRSHLIHQPAPTIRPQSFFASTSCSIALSRERSATSRFSFAFSSSS